MNRVLFYVGVTFFASVLVAYFFSFNVNIVLGFIIVIILPAICWLFGKEFNKKVIAVVLITASVGFFYYSIKNSFEFEKLLALNGRSAVIEGVIISYPQNVEKDCLYDVKIEKISIKNMCKKFNAKLYLSDTIFVEPYERFKAKVKFFSPYLEASKGLKRYYKSKNQAIAMVSYNNENFLWIDKSSWKDVLPKFILNARRYLKTNLTKCYNNNQGYLMVGMLLGDKSGLDYSVKRIFSRSGISHLLAVSGLHLTILIQTVYSILSFFKLNVKKRAVASIIFTIFLVAIAGFSTSAVRAGIMNVIYLMGLLLNREMDSLNSIGVALILILSFNPFAALDVGLQLSFMATLSIILFKPKVYNMLYKLIVKLKLKGNSKVVKFICNAISVSVSAIILTSPVTIIQFGQVSLVAPITNVILAPVIQPTLILVIITATLGGITYFGFIYRFFAALSSIGVYIIKGVAVFMANLPFNSIYVSKRYLYIWFASVAILIGINKYWLKNQNMNKYIWLFSFVIILFGKLSNDIFSLKNITCNKITRGEKNYIISNYKAADIILVENEKHLLPNLDVAMNNCGVYNIEVLAINKNVGADVVIEIIKAYKTSKIIAKKETISLIINKITNGINDFEVRDYENNKVIIQKNIFGVHKIILQVFNKNKVKVNGSLEVS